MIPRGIIWQYLRTRVLSTVPELSYVSFSNPGSLVQWESSGYYRVVRTTSSSYHLEAAASDVGAALLSDAEHLLDAATEHQAALWAQIISERWTSPAWLTVTVYYWIFFLLLALTRLLGHTGWHINKDIVRRLANLSLPGIPKPGAGCFQLELGANLPNLDREIILRKHGTRIHEEIWNLWHSLLSSHIQNLIIRSSDVSEVRLYSAIIKAANALGSDWPSSFRNVVNYRLGFAYGAVRHVKVLDAYSYLDSPPTYDFEALLSRFETRASLMTRDAFQSAPNEVAKLLVDYAIVLHTITSELHAEILDRRRLDARWSNARHRFRTMSKLTSDFGVWPT